MRSISMIPRDTRACCSRGPTMTQYSVAVEAAVPVFRPLVPRFEDVGPLLAEIDSARVYTNGGPLVHRLESEYARFFGAPDGCVVAVSSGTSGLMAALLASGAPEWLMPAWTFAATPQAALRAGVTYSLRDVDPRTGYMDLGGVEPSEGVGLLPVVPFGACVDTTLWTTSRDVVIDAAASTGASRNSLSSLPSNWSVVFSLHATKILGCGEGGLVVCGSKGLASEVRTAINFGLRERRATATPGLNGKMPEILAAYALAALRSSDRTLEAWRLQAGRARETSHALGLDLVAPRADSIGPYWIVRTNARDRPLDELQRKLSEFGIETRRWWPETVAEMMNVPHDGGRFPNAEELAATCLGIPLSVDQSEDDFDRVAAAIAQTRDWFGTGVL